MEKNPKFFSYMSIVLADLAALSSLLISGVACVGHLLKIDSEYHWISHPAMPLTVAVVVALLSLAILTKNRNQVIVMKTIDSFYKKVGTKEMT